MSDLTRLNCDYFHALRTAATRSIPDACAQFGVHIDVARLVLSMSLDEIDRLAVSGLVLFKLELGAEHLKRFLLLQEHRRHIVARLVGADATKEKTKRRGGRDASKA